LGNVPWRDGILGKPFLLKKGHLELSTKPGLGVRLIHSEWAKYRVNVSSQ
jgi:hypothetical protein